MIARVVRAILPLALVLAGAALVAYGARSHRQEVVGQEEIKAPSIPQADQAAEDSGDPSVPPPGMPGVPPGPALPWLAGPTPPPMQADGPEGDGPRIQEFLIEESEPQLIKEVTVGGLVLAVGRLKRTYVGDTPSLCPT